MLEEELVNTDVHAELTACDPYANLYKCQSSVIQKHRDVWFS